MVHEERVARLGGLTDLHVLCGSRLEGRYLCGREFGRIEELVYPPAAGRHELLIEFDPPVDYERPPNVALRVFRFPPGWIQRRDGVWDVAGAADPERVRLRSRADLHAWWSRVTGGTVALRRLLPGSLAPPEVPILPARAVCQQCRTVSELRAEPLRVSSPIPAVHLRRIGG